MYLRGQSNLHLVQLLTLLVACMECCMLHSSSWGMVHQVSRPEASQSEQEQAPLQTSALCAQVIFFPSHNAYTDPAVTRRVLDYFDFMNSKAGAPHAI